MTDKGKHNSGSDKHSDKPQKKEAPPSKHAHGEIYDAPQKSHPAETKHQSHEKHGSEKHDLKNAVHAFASLESLIHNPRAALKQAEHSIAGVIGKLKEQSSHPLVKDAHGRITDVRTAGGHHLHLEYQGNDKHPASFHFEGKPPAGLISRGATGPHESISFDQKTGALTHKQQVEQQGQDGKKQTFQLEHRYYPDGSQVHITSDEHGRRLMKDTIVTGKDGLAHQRTAYAYNGDTVTAVQDDTKGRVAHRYEWHKPKNVGTDRPAAREDITYDDKPPALREHHKTFDLSHGKEELVSKSDRVIDLENRVTKLRSERIVDGKQISQDMQFDRNGKPIAFHYKDESLGYDLLYEFKNGVPVNVVDAQKLLSPKEHQRLVAFGAMNIEAMLPSVRKLDDVTVAMAMPNTSKKEGFNGVLTNGSDTYKIDGGNVYDKSGKYIAKMDSDGRLHFDPKTGEQDKDASSYFKNGFQFIGNESGAARRFEISNKTCNGEITLPSYRRDGAPAPSASPDANGAERYTIHMGMIINPKTNEQLGNFVPPADINGKLEGGYIQMGNPPKRVSLADFKGAEFSVSLTGQTGEGKGKIEGTSLGGTMQADGTYKPGEGGLVNKNAPVEDHSAGTLLERQMRLLDRRPHILEDLPKDTATINGSLKVRNESFDIKEGKIYKAGSNAVVGSIDSTDGSMSWTNRQGIVEKTTMNDSRFTGAVWHLEYLNGANKQTVDWITTSKGTILSAAELKRQARAETAYAKEFDEESKTEQSARAYSRSQELEARYNQKLDQMLSTGAVDAETLKYIEDGPQRNVRAEHFREHTRKAADPKVVAVPVLNDDKACEKVSGQLRHGNAQYDIDHGSLYRVHFDATGQRVREKAPCGSLRAGYRAQIDGHGVDLNQENQTLLKVRVEGDSKEHRIIGTGRGLVEADELLRQARECKNQAQAGNAEYFNEMPALIGGTTDVLMGNRADVMQQIQQTMDHQTSAMTKNFDQLFNQGFSAKHLDNNQIDSDVRAVQHFMRDMNLSTQDMGALSDEGRRLQQQTADSAAIATTTVLTAGVGTAFSAMANTARFASLAETTGLSVRALALTGELAADTLVGGVVSTGLRTTQGADVTQVWNNFSSGMIEGGTMAVSAFGGRLLQGGDLGFKTMLAARTGLAAVNTVGFNAAGGIREGNLTESMSARNLALGMVFALGGDFVGSGARGLQRVADAKSPLGKFLQSKEMNIVFGALDSSANGFTNSALAAIPQAMELERQRIAAQLHLSPDAVSDELLNQNINYKNVYNYVVESGLQGGAMSGIMSSAAHPLHSHKGEQNPHERPSEPGEHHLRASVDSEGADPFDIFARMRAQQEKLFPEIDHDYVPLDIQEGVVLLDAQGNRVQQPHEQTQDHSSDATSNRNADNAELLRQLRRFRGGGEGGTDLGPMRLQLARESLGDLDGPDGMWRPKRSFQEFTEAERKELLATADSVMVKPEHVDHYVKAMKTLGPGMSDYAARYQTMEALYAEGMNLRDELAPHLQSKYKINPMDMHRSEDVLAALRAVPGSEADIAKYERFVAARLEYAQESKSLHDIADARQREMQKVLDDVADRMGLPKIELVLDAGMKGANGAYGDGKIRMRAADALDPAKASRVIETLYHELTHNRQDFVVVRMIMDELKIGTTVTAQDIQAVQKRYAELTQPKGSSRVLPAKYIAECLAKRDGVPLSAAECLDGLRFADQLKTYFNAGEKLKETANSYQIIANEKRRLETSLGLANLFEKLADPKNTQLANRLFGDQGLPAEVRDMIKKYQAGDVAAYSKTSTQKSRVLELLTRQQQQLSREREEAYVRYFTEIEQSALVAGQMAEARAMEL